MGVEKLGLMKTIITGTTLKFHKFDQERPKAGQNVLWVWSKAGQITAGDFYKNRPRDAACNYDFCDDVPPDYWCDWPINWP